MYRTKIISPPEEILDDIGALSYFLRDAAALIQNGELVAFPTETVYGLGADSFNESALRKIFEAKGRPHDNPLISHIPDETWIPRLALPISHFVRALVQHFSPGPITYIFNKKAAVPNILTAGLDTLAVRIPENKIARALIIASGVPIAAPSANLSGKPSPTEAAHVFEDMEGKIPLIIDGGSCDYGVESTILDLSDESRPKILRPGAVTAEALINFISGNKFESQLAKGWREGLCGKPAVLKKDETPKAPGMKYRHYAPECPVYLINEKDMSAKKNRLQDFLHKAFLETLERPEEKLSFGFYISNELYRSVPKRMFDAVHNSIITFNGGADQASKGLFSALRELDNGGAEWIIAEGMPEAFMGRAYMNRLKKAAAPKSEGGKIRTIIFACTGNTCRSPMAEAIFRFDSNNENLHIEPDSAGINASPLDVISENASEILHSEGIPFEEKRKARRLTGGRINKADLILTMTASQAKELRRIYPVYRQKIYSLGDFIKVLFNKFSGEAAGKAGILFTDVPDPYGGGAKEYSYVYSLLSKQIDLLIYLLKQTRRDGGNKYEKL